MGAVWDWVVYDAVLGRHLVRIDKSMGWWMGLRWSHVQRLDALTVLCRARRMVAAMRSHDGREVVGEGDELGSGWWWWWVVRDGGGEQK
jgi:hypothetical protein